jgi:hypothetical protein
MSFLNENFLYHNPIRHAVSSPKKKKRKYSTETSQQQHSDHTSINIIDRVLDFSKYKKHTGLYTLCRDWLHATTSTSDPPSTSFKQGKSFGKTETSASANDIKSLPLPKNALKKERKKQMRKSNDDMETGGMSNTDDLLKSHLVRWKAIRRECMVCYKNDSLPYKESLDILKSIYEDS